MFVKPIIANVPTRPELIAPGKTKDDWRDFAKKLIPGGDEVLWAEAFDSFLFGRLRSRYIDPITAVRDGSKWTGEGFTIVSIQCALIEFLAALRQGKKFRHENPVPPHEYKNSRDLFCDFLRRIDPFDKLFTKAKAKDFYANVRCGLLHEARTKGDWIIWASGIPAVDCQRKIVYRDSFQDVIERYIHDYGLALLKEIPLQEAFIRKFDDLAT
ncbi:hypothetical protein GOD90_16820 [Sinorhizobium medicae]|uniref:Uncharacterized protein n=2 Tax=Sinorhizobium medicae TaxID=110321 RepID=A6U8T7_SINMW|nr:hypothetical protein Smed_1217 [Sinorhizobium medicae WSM419]MDX0480541.1 hypothetical protein [Sinorhizobium medicae]MDX0838014.1 hypothetical protein [Sinorhizobium medicae]MDX0851356.1 hypothetical protein [Sinorhizobium medicae]MDX0898635.1 hypothetical protein [Sinorhizobium medicae]